MPELNIRLQIDPNTGKKNLIIEYESDSDALPHEHEEEHRALVNALVEGGVVTAEEVGKVVVERERSTPAGEEPAASEDAGVEARESVEAGEG